LASQPGPDLFTGPTFRPLPSYTLLFLLFLSLFLSWLLLYHPGPLFRYPAPAFSDRIEVSWDGPVLGHALLAVLGAEPGAVLGCEEPPETGQAAAITEWVLEGGDGWRAAFLGAALEDPAPLFRWWREPGNEDVVEGFQMNRDEIEGIDRDVDPSRALSAHVAALASLDGARTAPLAESRFKKVFAAVQRRMVWLGEPTTGFRFLPVLGLAAHSAEPNVRWERRDGGAVCAVAVREIAPGSAITAATASPLDTIQRIVARQGVLDSPEPAQRPVALVIRAAAALPEVWGGDLADRLRALHTAPPPGVTVADTDWVRVDRLESLVGVVAHLTQQDPQGKQARKRARELLQERLIRFETSIDQDKELLRKEGRPRQRTAILTRMAIKQAIEQERERLASEIE
jgi:hypothetical protein